VYEVRYILFGKAGCRRKKVLLSIDGRKKPGDVILVSGFVLSIEFTSTAYLMLFNTLLLEYLLLWISMCYVDKLGTARSVPP